MTDTTQNNSVPQARIRVSGVPGLVAMVPYLLGYHPSESLVVVLIDQHRVGLTLRLDLPGLLHDPDDVAGFVDGQIRRLDATHVLLVAYADTTEQDVVGAVADLAVALDVEAFARGEQARVLDAVAVTGGRYRVLACAEPGGCSCSGQGHDYQAVLADPAAAEAVMHGLQARPSRESLRSLIAPGSEPVDHEYQALVIDAADRASGMSHDAAARVMERRLQSITDIGRVPNDQVLAEITGLACHPAARDVATLRIEPSTAELWADVWAAAARRVEGPLVVAPLGLVGITAWARGTGALLNLCLDEAEHRAPDHGLVPVLRHVADHGLHPDEWTRMRAQALAESD